MFSFAFQEVLLIQLRLIYVTQYTAWLGKSACNNPSTRFHSPLIILYSVTQQFHNTLEICYDTDASPPAMISVLQLWHTNIKLKRLR